MRRIERDPTEPLHQFLLWCRWSPRVHVLVLAWVLGAVVAAAAQVNTIVDRRLDSSSSSSEGGGT